jgi:hypothetical protein
VLVLAASSLRRPISRRIAAVAEIQNEEQITLYFHDDTIAFAFGALLSSLGYETATATTPEELTNATRVITEPLYFKTLSSTQQSQCLLVGNAATSNEHACPVIRQPLTPEKIERGLQAFLGSPIAH